MYNSAQFWRWKSTVKYDSNSLDGKKNQNTNNWEMMGKEAN